LNLEEIFYEESSRSILVPKDQDLIKDAELKQVIADIISKEGSSTELFDKLFSMFNTV